MNVDLIHRTASDKVSSTSSFRVSGCSRSLIKDLAHYKLLIQEEKPKKWDGFEFKIPKSVEDMSFKGDMAREFELDMQRIEYCYRKWKKKLKKKKIDIIDAESVLPGCCLTNLQVIASDEDIKGILAIETGDSEIKEFAEMTSEIINSNNA